MRYKVTFRSGEEAQNLECVIYRDFTESEGEKELSITTKKARAIMENADKIREELGSSQVQPGSNRRSPPGLGSSHPRAAFSGFT